MKKLGSVLISIVILFLVLMPCDFAWKWSTHSNIVEKTYFSLPNNIQKKLNLKLMKDGSNDPDEKFQDFTNHNFPNSYKKSKYWLDKGKTAYKYKNYNYASYCFGVASHYISDTFSAPHSVDDTSSLHSTYEKQATYLKPVLSTVRTDLYTTLKQGDSQGKKSWNTWKKTKKSSMVQKDLNRATSATYSAIRKSIN